MKTFEFEGKEYAIDKSKTDKTYIVYDEEWNEAGRYDRYQDIREDYPGAIILQRPGNKFSTNKTIRNKSDKLKNNTQRREIKMTLRELLLEDGYTSTDDTSITVHDGGLVMAVSHRYLSGGWEDKLEAEAIKIDTREYTIIRV